MTWFGCNLRSKFDSFIKVFWPSTILAKLLLQNKGVKFIRRFALPYSYINLSSLKKKNLNQLYTVMGGKFKPHRSFWQKATFRNSFEWNYDLFTIFFIIKGMQFSMNFVLNFFNNDQLSTRSKSFSSSKRYMKSPFSLVVKVREPHFEKSIPLNTLKSLINKYSLKSKNTA